MKLLPRSLHDVRHVFRSDGWFSGTLLFMAVGLELVGRLLPNDFMDALAASILALMVLVTVARHRKRPLPWVHGLTDIGRRVGLRLRSWQLEVGLDLRGQPALPPGFPPPIRLLLVVLLAWGGLLLAFPGAFPAVLRDTLGRYFYLGYLIVLVSLWSVLAFCLLSSVIVPTALIHDYLVGRFKGVGRRSRNLEPICWIVYFGSLFLGYSLLPIWFPLVLGGLVLIGNLTTLMLPVNPDIQFVWRYADDRTIHSVPWGRWVTCVFTLMILVVLVLALTANGTMLAENPLDGLDAMPLTTLMGLFLSWLGPGALGLLMIQTILGRLRDPARPCPRVVHVGGAAPPDVQMPLARALAQRGWQARFGPAPAQPTDVPVVLTTPADALPAMDDAWPLPVGAASLAQQEVLDRLQRRDEIQNRRRLLSGLEFMFKRAARRKYRCGGGFWVALHYWFLEGLVRDTPEEEVDLEDGTLWSMTIGPHYHRVLPRSARHHCYEVWRALQIDLVFVEDGVSFRRFARVLRMMFELYDIHGGKRRAEELHFRGLPGTRVLIHEFQLTDPFQSDIYPEPQFDKLGRARILHVFKDRGEQEERLDVPLDSTFTPVPSLVY